MSSTNVPRLLIGTLGTALCASLCLFAAASQAAPQSDPAPRQTVEFADLDLTREPGRRTLEARLLAAARAVCTTGAAHRRAQADCIREAIETARPATN